MKRLRWPKRRPKTQTHFKSAAVTTRRTMSHVPAPESTPEASQPESGPVSDRDAQDAREARYAEAIEDGLFRMHGITSSCDHREEARAVMAVADAELAPLVARVAELEAEVERLRQAMEDVTAHLRSDDPMYGAEAVVDDIDYALAAAGPAVSDGPPEPSEEWVKEDTQHGPIFRCRHCQGVNDWTGHRTDCPVYRAAVGRSEKARGLSSPSDGEGATSEAGACPTSRKDTCYNARCPDPKPCHAVNIADGDGTTSPDDLYDPDWETSPIIRPASPVVAPSATDEAAFGITVPCPVCGRTDGEGVRFHVCPPTDDEADDQPGCITAQRVTDAIRGIFRPAPADAAPSATDEAVPVIRAHVEYRDGSTSETERWVPAGNGSGEFIPLDRDCICHQIPESEDADGDRMVVDL